MTALPRSRHDEQPEVFRFDGETEGAAGLGHCLVATADEFEKSAHEAALAPRVDRHHRPELSAVDLAGAIARANLPDFAAAEHEVAVAALLMRKGEGFRIWCDTAQDLDAIAARLRSAGFSLTEEPADHPAWGVRSFSVDDPDGFHITIARDI